MSRLRVKYNFKVGDKIGYLVVTNNKILKKKHNLFISVRCERCEREFFKQVWQFVKGQGCICACRESGKASFTGYMEISGVLFSKMKANAKIRNLEFSVTIKDLWNRYAEQNGKCALSGQHLFISPLSEHSTKITASLDRINSDEGYTKDNVQWVHKDINLMKNYFEEGYFITMCRMIANYKK